MAEFAWFVFLLVLAVVLAVVLATRRPRRARHGEVTGSGTKRYR